MRVNWKVRLRNRHFWLQIVPALLLLAQVAAAPFGYAWDFVVLNEQVAAIVNAAFSVLTILGVVADPTTEGLGDSERAMGYERPA